MYTYLYTYHMTVICYFSIPPKISPTKSNTSTFGTKHFFVGDGWVSRLITRQVFDFVEGLFWDHLGGTSNHVFGFVGFWGFRT